MRSARWSLWPAPRRELVAYHIPGGATSGLPAAPLGHPPRRLYPRVCSHKKQ